MKLACVIALLPGGLMLAAPALARPAIDLPTIEAIHTEQDLDRPSGALVAGPLSATTVNDTVLYGGTYWAADSMRWEAIRGGTWTFDTGIGSTFGSTGPNKPSGYHTLMEGWYGIDFSLSPLPYFRRSTTCALNGSWSFWAGVTAAEANALCYASGQGYGNNWNLEIRKTFAYPGSGAVTLSYRYANDSEDSFDYTYVLIDTTGNGSAADVLLRSYTGVAGDLASIALARGTTLPSTARNIIIKFTFQSDGSYSDEDGLNPTTCGAFVVDDVQLTGAITDLSTFETGANGWAQITQTTGVGDYSNIVDRNTALPAPVTFCACGVHDSVLVFFDENQEHPLNQDNIAASPWIDLKRGGDVSRPGKLIMFDAYYDMPLANYILDYVSARYYPAICPATGQPYTTGWLTQNVFYFYEPGTWCTPDGGSRRIRDFSGVIGTGAERVQIGLGVVNLCEGDPFGTPCTGISNTTPWFDNVSLGVFGNPTAPNMSLLTFDLFQDAFATDGSMNPASTGRIDTNTLKNSSSPGPGSILRDTLVVRGDGGNTEVRMVFHVRPGPFTNSASLAAWATQWTPEPALGAGWYSARMDTAEQAGQIGVTRGWMSCFHESDPGFHGTDRAPDPADPSQLENEILPDRILTPGSRIDYFVKARYIPPDPRNVGGLNWYILPDTTGRTFYEVEILPSSMAADTTWNCTLYVDHHADRDVAGQRLEEAGLTASLGVGGNNAEGTRFDRWDVQTPSSGQLSFGRSIQTNMGASINQVFLYKTIVWHCGNLSSLDLTDEDANMLAPWLTMRAIGYNRFWGSGDGLATSMNASGEPNTVSFMKNILGVTRTCNTIRDVNCPNPSAMDTTYCLPTTTEFGAEFASPTLASVRGNGCPGLLSFDLIGRNVAVTTARGQLDYVKSGTPRNFASVTNHNTVDVDYKTVLDGFSIGSVRTSPANPHIQAFCSNTGASLARTDAVLDWFGTTLRCNLALCTIGLGDVTDGGTKIPQFRTSLGNAWPNPTTRAARIQFTVGVDGAPASVKIFDVTGRLVRTLADGKMSAGVHELTWDGMTDGGSSAPVGMYFYKLSAPGFDTAKKLLLTK